MSARVCRLADLEVERGVAALVDGCQVALYRLSEAGEVRAVANHDPAAGANVLARGIVGSAGEHVYVSSPMYKTRYDLRTGRCLDDGSLAVRVWPANVVDGWVEVGEA